MFNINVAIGIINPETLITGIDIVSSEYLSNSRADGTVDKVLLNCRPVKLIRIIEQNAKAIQEARSLIGL